MRRRAGLGGVRSGAVGFGCSQARCPVRAMALRARPGAATLRLAGPRLLCKLTAQTRNVT